MSLQENLQTFTYAADGAVGQYLFVAAKASAPRTAGLPATGEVLLGATLNKTTEAGQALTVANNGIIKVTAGGAIAVGAGVRNNAAGRAVTATAGAGCGIAITAATAAGQVIEVHWLGQVVAL